VCSNRVEVYVIARGPKISIPAAFHQLGFVATAQHVTDEFVPVIEPDSIGALQPGHAGDQVGVWAFQDQMVMIGHETISVNLPTGLLAGLGQGFEEIVPVYIVQKNVLTPVSSAHDVIHRSRIFNPQGAWHGPSFGACAALSSYNEPRYGLTPFLSLRRTQDGGAEAASRLPGNQ
jgi:hypothetical protein